MSGVSSSNWKGPGERPHLYTPDYQAMGDCRICGHMQAAHGPDGGFLAVAQARFPVGTKVLLKYDHGAKPDRRTKVTSAPVRLPMGQIVVEVACSTSTVGIDRIVER